MAGREKQRIFEYNSDGKFINKYSTLSEVKIKFFNNPQYPLFRNDKPYECIKGNYFFKSKVGRKIVVDTHRIETSPYVPKRKLLKTTPIEVYNLKGDLLATFTSQFALSVLTNGKLGAYNRQVNQDDNKHKTKFGGLIFKEIKT